MYVDVHTFHRHVRPLRDSLDDSQIRLMWHHEVHVIRVESGAGEGALARGRHALHRAFEDLLTLELPSYDSIEHTAVGVPASHALYAQDFAGFPVTTQLLRDDAFLAL